MDRFLFKVEVGYPPREHEREMVRVHGRGGGFGRLDRFALTPVVESAFLERAVAAVAEIRMADEIGDYVVDVVRATREHPAVLCGASPRAAVMLSGASRAIALLSGRDYVVPDDVKSLARPVLRHRIVLSPAAEIEGRSTADVVQDVLQRVTAPR